ncbi:MAG: cytochrome family protein [Bacillales bacterium]|nr:cytochrome family protein [Bacillales bacterium]
MTILITTYVYKVFGAGPDISTITQLNNTVRITWQTDNAADGYYIYRTSPDKIERFSVDKTLTEFTDTNVNANTLYQYEVATRSGSPEVINIGAARSIYVTDKIAPSLPVNTAITYVTSSGAIKINWTASPDTDIAYYEIYKGATRIGVTSNTSFKDLQIAAETSNTYKVRAVDKAGNVSAYYSSVTVSGATVLTATGSQTFVRNDYSTQWEKTGNTSTTFTANGTSDMSISSSGSNTSRQTCFNLKSGNGMEVNDSNFNGGPIKVSLTLNKSFNNADSSKIIHSNTASYTTDGTNWINVYTNTTKTVSNLNVNFELKNGTAYSKGMYYLRVCNDMQNDDSDSSTIVTKISNLSITKPINVPTLTEAPSGLILNLISNNTKVELQWDAYNSTYLTGFKIERVNGTLTELIGTSETNSFIDPSIVPGTTYSYKVTAIDDRNQTSPTVTSLPISVPGITPISTPEKVTEVNVGAITPTSVDLNWLPAGGTNISKYIVYMSQDGSLYQQVGETTFTNFRVNGVISPNSKYFFRIVTVNDSEYHSAPTEIITVNTPEPDSIPPTSPANLTVTDFTTNTVSLSWTGSTDNTGLDRYEIDVLANNLLVKKVPFSDVFTTGTIEELNPDTNYEFKMVAVDTSGNKSGYSNTVSQKTDVDNSPPEYKFFKPAPDSVGVGTGTEILVRFDEAILLSTISGAVTLKDNTTNQLVSGTLSLKNPNEILFKPDSLLNIERTYTVSIANTIKNTSNVAVSEAMSYTFTTGATKFSKPHGDFAEETEMCKNCHSTHKGKKPELLNEIEIYQLCLQCHDGLGSTFNIKDELGGAYPSEKVSHHPIYSNTDESASKFRITCIDCHMPHDKGKDLDKGTPIPSSPGMLQSFNRNSEKDESGNGFCWNCHGNANTGSYGYLQGPSLSSIPTSNQSNYLTDYRGNHETNVPALNKGHNSSKMYSVFGGSGIAGDSQVKCISCHEKHGSNIKPLLREKIKNAITTEEVAISNNGKEFCYACHKTTLEFQYTDNSATSTLEFNGKDVNEKRGHSQFDCQVCHNPHGSQYPNGLRMKYIVTTGNISYSEANYALCFDCHDSNKLFSSGANTSDFGNLHNFKVKGRSTPCKTCHRPHGAIESEQRDGVSVDHKIGFPTNIVGGSRQYSRSNRKCYLTCHGEEHKADDPDYVSTAGYRGGNATNPWMLKADWKTSSKLLNTRPAGVAPYVFSGGYSIDYRNGLDASNQKTHFRDGNLNGLDLIKGDGFIWK